MRTLTSIKSRSQGFTLVEIAMVLLIVALLLGGLVPTISSQIEQRQISETNKQLDEIQQALIGYAITHGRLPCPAAPTATGAESPLGGGVCANPYNGFVPAATLGLSGTDSAGYAVDSWGNRIRYAVTQANANAFTTTSGMSTTGISNLLPDLLVCSTATGIVGTSCAAGAALTSNPGVPAVIFSTGKSGGQGSAGIDEAANLNGDIVFVSHTQTPVGSANGEFDHIVIWMSPNTLINRMVVAGQLP